MEYSKYILKKQESLNLKQTFECGQCFRWEYDENLKSYIGIVGQNVIEAKEDGENIMFSSTHKTNKDLEEEIYRYFNLSLVYDDIKKELIKKDKTLKKPIEYGRWHKNIEARFF